MIALSRILNYLAKNHKMGKLEKGRKIGFERKKLSVKGRFRSCGFLRIFTYTDNGLDKG